MKDEVQVQTRNRAKCLECGDVVESLTVHDLQWCRCGAMFVDGGKQYFRRGGNSERIEEISEE